MQNVKLYIIVSHYLGEVHYTDCPPQKITIGIWVSIAKEPFMESEKSNRIIKLLLFIYNSVKTPSDLAK